jgi:hypothetical protein
MTTEQSYLIIENNIVTNTVTWDGNVQTWTPPAGSIQLIQATTPAMVWEQVIDSKPPTWALTEVLGAGDIGFTWNGTVLTTNKPEPQSPVADPNQPSTTGTVTA